MYQTSAPLQVTSNYLSDKWSFTLIGLRMKKLCLFCSGAMICPENFRTRSVERFCHNSSHRSSKLMILDALEIRLDEALNKSINWLWYSSDVGQKLITTATLRRWWWFDRTIFTGMLHTYCLNKQFCPKTLVLRLIDTAVYLAFHLSLLGVGTR